MINGRTDVVKLEAAVWVDPCSEAAARIKFTEQAGTRALYPVGVSTGELVSRSIGAVSMPLNVTAHPVNAHGAGKLTELRELGVRRVSVGTAAQMTDRAVLGAVAWLNVAESLVL